MPSVERVTDQRTSDRQTTNLASHPDSVLWWSIVASALLHIVLLLLFGYFSTHSSRGIDGAKQSLFELVLIEPVETAENEPVEPSVPVTTPPEPENTEAPVTESAVEPAATMAESTNRDEFDDATIDDLGEETPAASATVQINAERIRTQLREQLNASITLQDDADPGRGLLSTEPVKVPGMPAAAGWLNNYVGTVEASIERWGNPGGPLNARVVLPSGHVICVQGAAPAHGEIFHIGWPPVAMSRICGRVRPTPIDTSDIEHRPMIRPRHAQQ